jgi:CDP-diacylglycerol--glycerol-3-phosphate 3-phosphatidyltransferase
MKKSKWRYIPNILTILRLLAIPLMAVWMISEKWEQALILFIAAEFTDILDGYIARRFNFISNFGKLVDPLADKLIQLTAIFLLAHGGKLPYYFFYILIGKELAMVVGALFFLKKDVVVSSNWVGKAAASVLFISIILAFLDSPFSIYMLWIGMIISLTAAVVYLKGYLKQVQGREMPENREQVTENSCTLKK